MAPAFAVAKDIRLDVLPSYKFDPLLSGPTMCVPYTPAERREAACMLHEDTYVHQLTNGVAPPAKPRALKQIPLRFAK